MSRYDPASMRDALALVSALALGETTTAVHLAQEHAADPLHAESMIAALAYLGSRFVADIARTSVAVPVAERSALTADDLEPGVRLVLEHYGVSIAAQLEDGL